MTDARIVSYSSVEGIWADLLLLPDGTLDTSNELATAVKVALLTDARADREDVLPDPNSEDRRGWWGDTDAQAIWDGWPIGTKCWLLSRAKITDAGSIEGSTVARAEAYVRVALQPFIDKQICSQISVVAERVGINRIDVMVTIYRGPLDEIVLRFQDLWNEIRIA
jgi:phage gp46-like protein